MQGGSLQGRAQPRRSRTLPAASHDRKLAPSPAGRGIRSVLRRTLIAACLVPARPAAAQVQTVFAAASLNEALSEIASAWERAGHAKLRLAFAASSSLARQI